MMKLIIFLVMALCLSFSFAQDERYYMLHPKKMEQALERCSKHMDQSLSCEQLQRIATHLNEKAYQVQSDPQAFGKKILALQQMIANQEGALRKNPKQAALQTALNENKLLLDEHLLLVRWLESPES